MLWLSSLYIAIYPTNSIHFQFIKDAKILLKFFQFLKTYALKLAHLFTYYNYNYMLYTSQDCETILYNHGDGILFGDSFFVKVPMQTRQTDRFLKII